MVKIMMALGLAVCCAVVCSVALSGCGGKSYTGERRYPLSGKVTVDGEPMPHGLISFLPQGEGRVAGGPIAGGSYFVEEEKGATAGTYRVEIHWSKPTGKKVYDRDTGEAIMDQLAEGLPAKYHAKSELTAEVGAKKTTFDFDLQSK